MRQGAWRLLGVGAVALAGLVLAQWASQAAWQAGPPSRVPAQAVAPAQVSGPPSRQVVPERAAFRTAPAAVLRLKLLAVEQDAAGRWTATLRVNEGPLQRVLVGDTVSAGVRVERIGEEGAEVLRGGRVERLDLPPGTPAIRRLAGRQTHPRPVAAPSVVVVPAGALPPTTSAVDRAIERAVVTQR